MQTPDSNEVVVPEPVRYVTCRVCERPDVPATGLSGHIGTHHRTKTKRWNKREYLAKYPDTRGDFADKAPPKHVIEANIQRFKDMAMSPEEKEAKKQAEMLGMTTEEAMLTEFSGRERKEYDDMFERVFQDIYRDEVQRPLVHSLAYNQVLLNRLYTKVGASKAYSKADEERLDILERRVSKLRGDLGLTRAQKMAAKDLKTSPAALLSDYLTELERMSPESLQTLVEEERKVLSKAEPRIEKYILALAESRNALSDEADDKVEPDIDSVLRRAGFNA